MEEKVRESIALFRHGIIAPLMSGHVVRKDYLESVCKKTHTIPHYGEKQVKEKTILEWLRNYTKSGFDGLKPKVRQDNGGSRRLSPDTIDEVLAKRKKFPLVPIKAFYKQLIELGMFTSADISYSSFCRLINAHKLEINDSTHERKRFAHDKVNTMWQGDLSYGPYINENGKKYQAYLVAYIDDCSRLVPFAQFFNHQNFDTIRVVTKEAITRRGKPKIIYVDNGKIYRAEILQYACAQLNISLVNTKPYDPQSKGKIERFFRTVQTSFYPTLQMNPAHSLEELNKRFWQWLESEYHRKIHASLDGKTPHEVFYDQIETIQFINDQDQLEHIFLKRAERKVHLDGTISLDKETYEVPARFVGKRVDVRSGEKGIHIYEDGKPVAEVKKVMFNDNAHAKRNPSPFTPTRESEESEGNVHV